MTTESAAIACIRLDRNSVRSHSLLILARGDPRHALEMPGKVALIAKSSLDRNCGDCLSLTEHSLGAIDPHLGLVCVRRKSCLFPKNTDQVIGAEP